MEMLGDELFGWKLLMAARAFGTACRTPNHIMHAFMI